jgi:hypothetical protein
VIHDTPDAPVFGPKVEFSDTSEKDEGPGF